jgi:hypothetical protein
MIEGRLGPVAGMMKDQRNEGRLQTFSVNGTPVCVCCTVYFEGSVCTVQ